MNSTTPTIITAVVLVFVSCAFGFDDQVQEREYYLTRVRLTADLDFGHGEINGKADLIETFEAMTVGDLKVTVVELYTTLECSYLLNLHYHTNVFKSYLLMETKPNFTADQIDVYSFAREAQRMLTAMHNVDKFSTAKYIVWMYLVYTEKIADIMSHPEGDHSAEISSETSATAAIVQLLERFIQDPVCKRLSYEPEQVFGDWPIYELHTMDYDSWTARLRDVRNTVHRQLDFNDSQGKIGSTEDYDAYSLDVLRLKGVFDEPGVLNYLIRKLLVNGDGWSETKLKSRALSTLPVNVDCNSLAISPASFNELRETVQTHYQPSLSEQIDLLVKFHADFILLLKAIVLQLVNKYLLTLIDSAAAADDDDDESPIEDRVPLVLVCRLNSEIANRLSDFVDILDFKLDTVLPVAVRFFNDIAYVCCPSLDLSVVSNVQKSLIPTLEKIGEPLFDGLILNTIAFDEDSVSADSVVETENGTIPKLVSVVATIAEIVEYIKENITVTVNFKGIRSFIDIEYSEELSALKKNEGQELPE